MSGLPSVLEVKPALANRISHEGRVIESSLNTRAPGGDRQSRPAQRCAALSTVDFDQVPKLERPSRVAVPRVVVVAVSEGTVREAVRRRRRFINANRIKVKEERIKGLSQFPQHAERLRANLRRHDALRTLGYNRLRLVVTAGALMGMLSSLLVYQYGQARIWFAMSRDGLLPRMFSAVHKRFQTPHVSTWIAGFVVGIPAGIWDIDTFAELSNIGTLFAFVLVSVGVIVLRAKQPDRPRSFRVPLVPLFPIVSIVCCVVLMMGLPLLTWLRFFVWLAIGLAIYIPFGRKRSSLAGAE